jgi:hypothetical protein
MGWVQFAICAFAAYRLNYIGSDPIFYFAVGVAVANLWSFGVMHNFRSSPQLAPNSWTLINILSMIAGVGLLFYSFVSAAGTAQEQMRTGGEDRQSRSSVELAQQLQNPSPPYWWQREYAELVRYILDQANGAAQTKYVIDGNRKMFIGLRAMKGRGLSLYLMPPKGVLGYRDESSGELREPEIVVVWDSDLDTKPDGFWTGKRTEKLGDLTPFSQKDFEGKGGATPILLLWNTAMGFGINHFLHHVDSSLPEK